MSDPVFTAFSGLFKAKGKTEIQVIREYDPAAYREVFYVLEINYANRLSFLSANPPGLSQYGPFTHEEMTAIVKLLTAEE